MKRLALGMLCVLMCLMSSCNKTEKTSITKEEPIIDETITLVALGDNLMHIPVINSGRQEDGSYDYAHLYENLQPMIRDADISVIGQETIFGGDDRGYSGYPLFNSPTDLGRSLVKEEFDVVLHASNHVLDKGESGIENTLEFWKEYPQVTVLGINDSPEDKETIDIMEVKGAKIALLNYTYGANGFMPSASKEYLVNFIDEEKIEKDVKYAEENADFTIAFMHWGIEYSTKADSSQRELAEDMCSWGTDLIIGSHPHVIEPAEWIETKNGNRMFVYYSLGNYVSRQLETLNLLGGVANVTLKYNGKAVSTEEAKFMPIITHYDVTHTRFSVYPLKDYSSELASAHGLGTVTVPGYYEKVDAIFEDYDKSVLDY